ncbi:MAG: hypothetical protein K2P12_04450 [Clostridia bacterium]|nr:hypothetical protein [Clostridia bacterium]
MNKLDIAKKRAELLKDREVRLQVNEGRNRFVCYDGKIDELYPYVFTFKAFLYGEERLLSFSYVDMMTKRIKIFPPAEKNEEVLS